MQFRKIDGSRIVLLRSRGFVKICFRWQGLKLVVAERKLEPHAKAKMCGKILRLFIYLNLVH